MNDTDIDYTESNEVIYWDFYTEEWAWVTRFPVPVELFSSVVTGAEVRGNLVEGKIVHYVHLRGSHFQDGMAVWMDRNPEACFRWVNEWLQHAKEKL